MNDPGTDETTARLVDRQAIGDLLCAFARHLDLYEIDEVAALFTPDCVVDYGRSAPVHGREAWRTALARGMAAFAATSHHVTNHEVVFEDADRARSRAYVHAWHRLPGDRADGFLWARYDDVVVRRPEGWRIAERVFSVAGEKGFPDRWRPIGRRQPGATAAGEGR